MIAGWLLVSCALSGVSMAACAAAGHRWRLGAARVARAPGVATGAGLTTTGGGGTGTATGRARARVARPISPSLAELGGRHRAGVGGGASGAGGSGGGAMAATCNGAALCDSFERTMLGPDWTLDNSTASTVIEVVTDKAHTGTNSVHISFGTTTLQSYISESKSFPAMGNAFWGRAWIFSNGAFGWSPNLHRSTRRALARIIRAFALPTRSIRRGTWGSISNRAMPRRTRPSRCRPAHGLATSGRSPVSAGWAPSPLGWTGW